MIKLLVESGADSNIVNEKGQTAYAYDMENHHAECVLQLLKPK